MLLTQEERIDIENEIGKAEKICLAEIRVHIDRKLCGATVLDSAAQTFAKIGMQHTTLRNGVLIYIAAKDRQFAIIGDVGINQHTGADFWNEAALEMQEHFRNGEFAKGIKEAIGKCAEKLAIYFPAEGERENELSNEISGDLND